MARRLAAVVFSLGCMHASSSLALGLGELTMGSFLNEPLKAKVDLLNIGGLHEDQIKIRLATKEDFERMGVDRAYFLTSISFDVTFDQQGQARIVITSEDPVLEPYLDFIVEARWPSGRLLREYTVLIDLPLFDESNPVISATERVAEVEGVSVTTESEKKTDGAAASSGTRVDVGRKSTLGPGEMPERDYNAAASDTPLSGRRYMISRDDTLWEIARDSKPSGATIHQTMLDIQRMNPKAFIDDNINRIKAGYIIYLPTPDEISSDDLAAALAEVRQQNDDWEAGRASKPIASSGPSLRISVDPVEEDASASSGSDNANDYTPAASAADAEDQEKSALERQEMAGKIASMEEQVETLQRIVSLKDDQIAALQEALAESGGDAVLKTDVAANEMANEMSDQGELMPLEGEGEEGAGQLLADMEAGEQAGAATDVAEPEPALEPNPVAKTAPKPKPAPEEGGLMSTMLYGLGALLLAIIAFLFLRRRGQDKDESPAPATSADDVFAEVKLKEQKVEVLAEPEPAPEPEPGLEVESEGTEIATEAKAEEVLPASAREGRGYGGHKHDEYASDVDTGDALAEADIYIAYGRYPQAVDLLNNALANDASNPAYYLKLLELYVQMDDREAAEAQLRELEAIGDGASLERAREILDGTATDALDGFAVPDAPPSGLADEVAPALEADFGGLEIEGGEAAADDLDLSADFSDNAMATGDDEDLVIAAEANGMSTKLDLARAYLDMGDDDGARQILDEVMVEGSEEQQAEAKTLLEHIG